MFNIFRKSKIIIGLGFFVLLIISVSSYYYFKKPSTSKVNEIVPEVQSEIPIQSIPQPEFVKWIESNKLLFAKATPKENSSRYLFKTEYRPEEITRLSDIFATKEEYNQSGNYHLYTNLIDSPSFFLLNTDNGEVVYSSITGIPLVQQPANAQTIPIEEQIYTFIKTVGLYDDSLRITATYSKENDYIRYYELHRDWEIMGYPILNPIGLLNIKEENSLHEISYFFRNLINSKDDSILDTSDNKDGFARNNDFNTITIGIDLRKGNVVSFNSNIRPLLINTAYSPTQLFTREEALNLLQEGKMNFFISKPSGEGDVSFTNVYPNNRAVAENAVIEEEILVYLEKPSQLKQDSLEPYYLFRGYSELNSGYRVTFYAAVSAIKNLSNSSLAFNGSEEVAGIMAQNPNDSSQKQGTLEFPTAAPSAIPTITSIATTTPNVSTTQPSITVTDNPTVNNTSTPTKYVNTPIPTIHSKRCQKAATTTGYDEVQQFEGLTFAKVEASEFDIWYIVLDYTDSYQEILDNVNEYINAINRFAAQNDIEPASLDWFKNQIISLSKNNSDGLCRLAVTSSSPSLFLYSGTNQTYTISLDKNIVYSDPSQINNQWSVKTQGNSILVNNNVRSHIYYEYKSLTFNRPEKGWLIKSSDVVTSTDKIGTNLGLNQTEKDRLVKEFIIALGQNNSEYLFIGVISDIEINKKLPLHVYPSIQNVQRIHFYITPSKNIRVSSPVLSPIKRTSEMIVELGAVLVK